MNTMEKPRDAAFASGATHASTASEIPSCDSLDEVYLELAVLLRRIAIRKFNVPSADAENLVHDIFANFLMSARTVRSDLRSYLVGAICNASRNYWRSRRSADRLFTDGDSLTTDVLTDDMFNGVARNLLITSTLARLGERCREALRRYYLDGEDTRLVAAAMKTTPSNVNYMMHVCRKRAREICESITRARSQNG